MKKINTVLVLIGCFIFSFFVQGSNNNISAKVTNVYTNNEEISGCVDRVLGNPNANFWEYTCSAYSIENNKYDTSGKYRFSHEEHFNHNYSFDYDYQIQSNNHEVEHRVDNLLSYVNEFKSKFSNLLDRK